MNLEGQEEVEPAWNKMLSSSPHGDLHQTYITEMIAPAYLCCGLQYLPTELLQLYYQVFRADNCGALGQARYKIVHRPSTIVVTLYGAAFKNVLLFYNSPC